MSLRTAPFESVLKELREDLREGRLSPGQHLSAPQIARQAKLSQTPVREALARLAGEGLIERREGGYFTWRLSPAEWVDLTRIHSVIVAYCVMTTRTGAKMQANTSLTLKTLRAMSTDVGAASADFVERLFHQLAMDTGNRHVAALEANLSDRLHLLRRAEIDLDATLAETANEMAELYDVGELERLLSRIGVYFRERAQLAHAAVAIIERQKSSDRQGV